MRAVVATGTPVVLVLVAGRPSASEWVHEHCAAVLDGLAPRRGGRGRRSRRCSAGEVNPGGKLPISFPRSVGQIPVFYAHKVSGGRSHRRATTSTCLRAPLYPFGHGLSYTTFELSECARPRADGRHGRRDRRRRRRRQHGRPGGRRGRAALCSRPAGERHAAGARAQELRCAWSSLRASRGRSRSASRSRSSASTTGSSRTSSSRARSRCSSAGRPTTLIEAGTVTVTEEPAGERPTKAFDGSVSIA